jgi:hypothetical protein
MSMSADWMDEVSLAYASNFTEIEAARAHFDEQRTAIIAKLRDFARTELARTGLEPTGKFLSKADTTGPWWNIHLKGQYASARKDSGDDTDAAGVGCGFASGNFWDDGDDVELGIYAYLSFTAKKQEAQAILAGSIPSAFCRLSKEVRVSSGGIYFVGPTIRPETERFTFASTCEVLASLIGAFSETDERMARRYRDVRQAKAG